MLAALQKMLLCFSLLVLAVPLTSVLLVCVYVSTSFFVAT